jgi:hypothetical protein
MGQRRHPTNSQRYIFYGKGNENRELGTAFPFVHNTIISAVKRVEFGNRMSYIILRWCDIIVLKVCALTEDNIDEVKTAFTIN